MQDNNTTPQPDSTTPPPVTPETPAAAPAPEAPASAPTTPDVAAATTPASPETPAAATAPTDSTAPAAPGAKNHLVAVLLSIFVGSLGVDRFYLGHIGLGVAKLLLGWLTFGIWWLVDVILIATRKVKNVTWED